MHVHLYISACVRVCTHVHVCVRACACVCVYMCVCVCVYKCVRVCVCVSGFDYCYYEIFSSLLKLKFFDTVGQERFNSLTTQFYRNTRFVILVFDYYNAESLRSLRSWLENARTQLYSPVISFAICLVGLKEGGVPEDRPSYDQGLVTNEMMDQFRAFHTISDNLCFEVTLGNGDHISHLLLQLAKASKKLSECHHKGLVSSFALSDDYSGCKSYKSLLNKSGHGKVDADTQTEQQHFCSKC